MDVSQEEAHKNFSDEFTSEVSIHLLLVFQFYTHRGRYSFYGWQLFSVRRKVTIYLLSCLTSNSLSNFKNHSTLDT